VRWIVCGKWRYEIRRHGSPRCCTEHRIADRRILRLIDKWLADGVVEDGIWSQTVRGSAQGASASPLLANVYLH
jgi:RNA-directed DNA polymerase